MPLTSKIETHINNIDKMKDGIKTDITILFEKLNAANFLENPSKTVDILIFAITERIVKTYLKPIVKESQRHVKDVLSTKSSQKL